MKKETLTVDELIYIYDLVFSTVHSDGFKIAEARSLLYDQEYWFAEKPKDGWKDSVLSYLDSIDFNKSLINLNKIL